MAQKTNLNVAPYYDDFEGSDNFVRTLFRPGFAIQARRTNTVTICTSKSKLSNTVGTCLKKVLRLFLALFHFNRQHSSLKLASTYAGETLDPSQYYSATTPVTITGATTGVTAIVIGYDVATTTDQPTLYLRYLNSGTDGSTIVFADGENISSNAGSYSHNSIFCKC